MLLLVMVPATALDTTAAQQGGNFVVSVAGTAVGSIPHQIDPKLTQLPGGQASPVTGFIVGPEDVVQVKQGENLIVSTSPDLSTHQVTVRNIHGIPIDWVQLPGNALVPSPSNVWSLQGLIPGIYTLDVTADMSSSGILGIYETYLVVLEPGQQPLPPTTVITQITIEYTEDCPGNSTLVNGTCVEPPCPVNSTLVNGTCVNPPPPTPPIPCLAGGISTNQTCPPLPCPNGTSTNGTCLPLPLPNATVPLPNATILLPNATGLTPPGSNATGPTPPGGGGGGVNQTIVPGPLIECPEGEQLSPAGLSCEPIVTEVPMPIVCGEGEELVDGQCQAIPTVDEIEPEPDENGGGEGEKGAGENGAGENGAGENGDGENGLFGG